MTEIVSVSDCLPIIQTKLLQAMLHVEATDWDLNNAHVYVVRRPMHNAKHFVTFYFLLFLPHAFFPVDEFSWSPL
jgi:hypothetical protein